MEVLTENEIRFLLALNASEESSVPDLREDFEKRDTSQIDVIDLLESLITDDVLRFGVRNLDGITDYSKKESLQLVAEFDGIDAHDVVIFLTDKGSNLWENHAWGITRGRAHSLMFGRRIR